LSWTPDGASVLLFSTLDVQVTGSDGQGYYQTRGALEIMRVDGTEATRTLVAYGRATSNATGPGGGILPVNIYSPPLFTWDLTAGSSSYTDMHEAGGPETIGYAPSFQVGPTGKLTPALSAGSITPWSYGALSLNTYGPAPVVQFQSSVWAWSADGRYVSPDVATVAYINVTNAPPTAPPGYPGAYKPLFVAPPDAATVAVVREITPPSSVIYVARDPRGARLASFACQPNMSIGKLTIRATTTGKTLLTAQYTFPTVSYSFGCPGDAEAINWSPDGSRVAMTDSLDNQIIIWQIPQKA
jgi:WD40 repeat protein